MQASPAYYPTTNPSALRRSWVLLAALVLFLILGAAIGFFVAKGAMKGATLTVQIENRTDATQDFAIFLNGAQVAATTLAPGQTTTHQFAVEWSGTASGMYEVRAVAALGGQDSERVTVSNGQTLLVHLRVG